MTMLIVGIVLAVAGIASRIYGEQLNSNWKSVIQSWWDSGQTAPGQLWITLGTIALIVGIILVAIYLVQYFRNR